MRHNETQRKNNYSLHPVACNAIRHFANKAVDIGSNASEPANADAKPNTFLNRVTNSLTSVARIVFRKPLLNISGKNIYQCCADQVDYNFFFKVCNMPDTFQSWFLVLHLHVWMCYVRLTADGKEGQIVNKQMVACMWEDIRERMKVIGVGDSSTIKKTFNELTEQFYGILIAYNKGYLAKDETVIVDALRRNIFSDGEHVDERNLDALLRYVTEQLTLLDEIPSEELLTKGRIKWLSLSDFVVEHQHRTVQGL